MHCFKFTKQSIKIQQFFAARARYTSSMSNFASQTNSTELQLFAGKLTANPVYLIIAQNLCVIWSLKPSEETSKLPQGRNLSGKFSFFWEETLNIAKI